MALQKLKAYDEFVEFITAAPSIQEIAAYFMSEEAQSRISELLDANQSRRLTDAESAELDDYQELGRIVRRMKIKAHTRLAAQTAKKPESIS